MRRAAPQILVCVFMMFVSAKAHSAAVATPSTWATEAAIDVLKQGGNAMDALVTATFVTNVTLPYHMGIGGGGFLLASHDGKKVSAWDSREAAPASAHEKMFLDAGGKPIRHYPEAVTGPNAVGVPGTVMGLWVAHQKLGSMPWKTLLQPAIKIARAGVPITGKFEEALVNYWERISVFPTTAALFSDGHGSHIKVGRTFRNPLLAETFEQIASMGGPAFYRGKLAESWISQAQKSGVKITLDDLKNYKVREVSPVTYDVFGMKAMTMTPPSAAGITVAGTLRYLERYYRAHNVPPADSPARVIVTNEALRYFAVLRNKTIADPPHALLDPKKWLGSAEEKAAWAEIDKKIKARLEKIQTAFTSTTPELTAPRLAFQALRKNFASLDKTVQTTNAGDSPSSHTAHLSIVDDKGMAVSYTNTIEEWFGSGITVTGHGFLLNNELSDFTKEPGQPNSPKAGKRPRSNMSPHLFFDKSGALVGAIGCAGGGRIPTVVVEALENFHLHKMTAREALAYSRFHPVDDDKITVERTMPKNTIEQLKDAGYDVEVAEVFGPKALGGTAQAVMRRTRKAAWEAASEPRADGLGLTVKK